MHPATWRAPLVLVALAAALSVRAAPARTDEAVRSAPSLRQGPSGHAPARQAAAGPAELPAQAVGSVSHLVGYLYVNNNGTLNSVRGFRLLSDGRLESLPGSPFPALARGAGDLITFPSSRPMLARRGDHLYAANTRSGSIAGFTIHRDGSLSHLPGSPFALTEPATAAVEGLAAHPTEPILFAADYTGLIRALAVTPAGALVPSGAPRITLDERPEGLAISPDGSVLAVSYGVIGGFVRTYQVDPSGHLMEAAGSPLALEGSQFAGSAAFSADGSRLFVASMSPQLGRIHGFAVLPSGELEEESGSPLPLEALPFPEGLALSADGSVLFATDPFTRGIASLALKPDGTIVSLGIFTPDEESGQPSGLETTPDGAFLLTTNFSHRSVSVLRIGEDGTLAAGPPPLQEADDDGLIDGGVLFVSADPDRDGLSLEVDNCPEAPNDLQEDRDGDGVGDVCDVCVARFDPAQRDSDGDGRGDPCETDADADGAEEESDNCPTVPNPDQIDTDADGRGDACDNCPDEANAFQDDADADGVGDACGERPDGFLYVNTNGGHNSVASFLVRRNGRLEPLTGSPFLTGGSGSLGSSLRLAFPGVVLAMGGRFVYATNADTRSVAGFSVLGDGTLRRIQGSPFNVGSLGPASMAVHEAARMLYVGFAQALGLQSLRIQSNGSLSPAPGFISTPGIPVAMAVSPDGRHLVVSMSRVQFHEIHALPLDASGIPRPPQAPPFVLPISSYPSGLVFDESGDHVYVSDENRLHVLTIDDGGGLSPSLGSPFQSRGTGGVMLAFSPDFGHLFSTDPAGNGVTSLKVGRDGGLPLAHIVAASPFPNAPGGEEPAGLGADASGRRLFVTNVGADLISIFNVDPEGTLRRNRFSPIPTGATGGHARGPVAFLPIDPDHDGLPFGADSCPFDAGFSQEDSDGDGSGDACDTCPGLPNPGNHDFDGDGAGDSCDADRDGDGIPDAEDVCPDDSHPDQADADRDGVGNRCDPCLFDPAPDPDGDLRCGGSDNCPESYNPAGEDEDGDGLGDPCDADADGDGIFAAEDGCPLDADPDQADRDGDGAGDACDNCPFQPNPAQSDPDADGVGIACADLPAGLVYINNDSFHANSVSGMIMSYAGGLKPLPGSPFPTGASSSFRETGMPRLVMDANRRLLFAVNDGAETNVAVLAIAADGSLAPAPGSPHVVAPCGAPVGLGLSPGGDLLIVAFSERCLVGVRVRPGGWLASADEFRITLPRLPSGMAVHPGGRYLALTYPDRSSVAVFDIGVRPPLEVAESPFQVNAGADFGVWSAAFDPSGGHLLVGSGRRAPPTAAYLFEVHADGSLEELGFSPAQGGGIGPTILAVTRDRRFVIGANSGTNDLDLYEFIASGFPAPRGVTANFFGSRLASGLALNARGDRAVVTSSQTADAGVFRIRSRGRILRLGSQATPTGDPLAAPSTGVVIFEGDADGDGLDFGPDNCPLVANVDQLDQDADGLGDACDNCAARINVDQADLDGDATGDVCDPDDDGDGVADEADICPALPVHGRGDQDRDGQGDACDPDRDGDHFVDDTDRCPTVPDPGQEDLDRDGVGDACETALLGVVYVATNAADNSIAGFSLTRGGALEALAGSPFATGGAGRLDVPRRFPELALSGSALVAANLGSGDLSALRIGSDGSLGLAPGSPVRPAGVLASGLAADPARGRVFAVGEDSAMMELFSLTPEGRLEPQEAIDLTGQARGIAFDPLRSVLAVSLTGNRIATFVADAQGDLAAAPGSPASGDAGGLAGPLLFVDGGSLLLSGNRGSGLGTIAVRSVSTAGGLAFVSGSPFASQADGVAWIAGGTAAPGRFRLMVLPAEGDAMRFVELTDSMQQVFSRSFQGRAAAEGPSSGLFSRDGSLLVVANGAGNVSTFHVDATGRPRVIAPAPSPTGAASGRPEGGILLIDGDVDGDGLDFGLDNCPLALNPDQEDRDGDGLGDLCDHRHPPQASAGGDRRLECGSAPAAGGGTRVTLDGRGSRDPDAAGSGGIASHDWFLDLGGPAEAFLGSGELLETALPPGSHRITLRVVDGDGQAATDTALILVEDTLPPALLGSIAPIVLFPPNHKLVEVRADLLAHDQCDPGASWTLESVSSDEPDDRPGGADGVTRDDIQGARLGTQDASVQLRAERDALGPGRTYTLIFEARDASGHAARRSLTVTVPRAGQDGGAPLPQP